jgi:hypothetical protein
MNIDDAIRFLRAIYNDRKRDDDLPDNFEGQKALKLGIEALKRLKRVRDGKPGYLLNLMPGETEK